MQADQTSLYIGGRQVAGSHERTFDTVNPATGERLATLRMASTQDVNRAVTTAREGFLQWSRKTGTERGQVLLRAANLLRERNDALAALEVADTGKPIAEASCVDVASGADALAYFAGIAPSIHGDHIQLGDSFAYTRREPLGVCAGIGAWNYPLQIACWKSAPALACGNSMIFKPAELTPLTALKLAEIYTEAGLPPGVFNVVQGDAEVGQMLTRHRGIAKVSLTGEVGTGRLVMADAATSLKHVTMELGGKSPLILFDDCDLKNAISAALMANFYTQGEICSNGTRVFVQRNLVGAFVDGLLGRVARMKVGDPSDPGTDVGALISHEHMQKVLGYIALGKKEGAKLLCGGEQVRTGALAKGNFVAPTVFADCTDDMTIVREEIFGPVMCILPFDDEAEVVARANGTEYGLASGVFTRDLRRGHRVAAQLESGICWINNYNLTPVEVPFGGVKQSGMGRENGLAALEHYTQLKTVYVEMGDVVAPY